MNKILLMVAVVAGLMLAGCNTNKKSYTVNGNIEGINEGNVYLLAPASNNSYDTIARSVIAEGKFVMNGTVDATTLAFLVIEGQRGGKTLFLEEGTFNVNMRDGSLEGGGIAQQLANQYEGVQRKAQQKQMELQMAYRTAYEEGNAEKMDEIREEFDLIACRADAKVDSLISANPDSYVSAYYLYSGSMGMELNELKEKYAILGENAKASTFGKEISDRISKLEAVAIGQIAPNFTMETPEGDKLSLHEIPGKVKLIDFWASWCGPCRGENPHVVKIYEEYHPKGLEILGVSLDNNREAWLKAIEDDKLTWKHVSDLKGWQSEASQLYAVSGIPHTLLLDENNRIIAKDLRGDDLKAKIAELLD